MANAKKKFDQDTIYDASKAEIVAFAADVSGIEFTGDEDREYMIRTVCEAEGWVEKDPRDGATHVVVKLGKEPGKLGEYGYRGGFNGQMFTIPRDKEVTIPIGYYNSIMRAAKLGFTVQPMEVIKEGIPTEDRIEVSGVPLSVIKFLKKG